MFHSARCVGGPVYVAIAEHNQLGLGQQRMLVESHAAGPVFCNTLGTYLRIGDVHDQFKAKRAGLPAIHPLRAARFFS